MRAWNTAVMVVLASLPGIVDAQSHGRNCNTSDTGYVYTIRTPTGDSRQHDIDVYFNNDRAAFVVLVFDDETDVRLATVSGLSSSDRFVHGSIRMYPDETYRISVGCVIANAAFRISVKRGAEISLSAPSVLNAHDGLTADEASRALEMEAAVMAERRRLLR